MLKGLEKERGFRQRKGNHNLVVELQSGEERISILEMLTAVTFYDLIVKNWTRACHTSGLELSPTDLWRGRRRWHPTPVLLPENPMDGGAWWAVVHGVARVGHN